MLALALLPSLDELGDTARADIAAGQDVFHAQRVIHSDLRPGCRPAIPAAALAPGFTPAPALLSEHDSSNPDQSQSSAPRTVLHSPPAHASFPPATQSAGAQSHVPGSEIQAIGGQTESRGVQIVDETTGRRTVLDPYHCPPLQAPSLQLWKDTWPNVPHWGAWPTVRNHFSAVERPVHELVLPPREVVRKYQLVLLEKLSRIFDEVVETQGGLPAMINEQGDLGSRIVALRHDIYRARQVLGRAVVHTDFKANIIFNHHGNISVGPLPHSPLSPIERDNGPSGVFAADPLEQMKADLFLLEYFHDLKDRLLAFTDCLSHSLPRMAMAFSGARRSATEHANNIRLRLDRPLLLPREITLELTDFDEQGQCMIRYEDDDRMPMVRSLPYVRRPNSILDPANTGSPRLLRLLRGRGGMPTFGRPLPQDLAPLVPFPRVGMSPPLAEFSLVPDLHDVWRTPAPGFRLGSTINDPGQLDPRSPRRPPAMNPGEVARRVASRVALRRSSSRVSPREQYLSHASSDFDAFAVRRRADTREHLSAEEEETTPRPRRDATPHGTGSPRQHGTSRLVGGRRIAPLPRRAL